MEIDKSFVDAMRNERGEGARGTRVSKPSTCRHVVVDSTDKEEKGSTSLGMIRHWPRHSLLSSKPRWRILSYFFFTFRFLPERERRKKERKKEKSLEQAYETAPTDAIRVEFSSSCKHEWKKEFFVPSKKISEDWILFSLRVAAAPSSRKGREKNFLVKAHFKYIEEKRNSVSP